MKTIIISGINLFEGGPLSIYYDCLDTILKMKLIDKFNVVAFVHKKELFVKYKNDIELIELPKSRKSYLYRLFYEYIYFYWYSKRSPIYMWLSLHDITPRVKAEKIYTYCHNPAPFLERSLKKATNIKYGFKIILFSYFYKFLYRINIKNADAVIVQQDWMRNEFKEMFAINNVIVAKPIINSNIILGKDLRSQFRKTIFIYNAYPRFFKNYEQICEACTLIQDDTFEVWFTIDGSENAYAASLKNKFKSIPMIKWRGIQTREEIYNWYAQSNALIFPSKLETWGLPISEYKNTGKDILLIDLPYAHEALGTYDKVMFFEKDNPQYLAKCMLDVIKGTQVYEPQKEKKYENPYASNWECLLNMILED